MEGVVGVERIRHSWGEAKNISMLVTREEILFPKNQKRSGDNGLGGQGLKLFRSAFSFLSGLLQDLS